LACPVGAVASPQLPRPLLGVPPRGYGPPVRRTSPIALVRPVPLSIAGCEVTHVAREVLDPECARAQHEGYVRALRDAGMHVVALPVSEEHPDSVFVEDLLLDLGDVRVLTSPGADSRRGERESVRRAFVPGGELTTWGPLIEMPDELRLDGGDVLRIGSVVFVGLSSRTQKPAVEWLDTITAARVVPVKVEGALHLKTAVSALTEHLLVVNPEAVNPSAFGWFDTILVPDGEKAAANALRLPPRRSLCTTQFRDERALLPAGCPQTASAVRRWGVEVIEVPIDELAKAEAGLTCMSVLLGADFALDRDALPHALVEQEIPGE